MVTYQSEFLHIIIILNFVSNDSMVNLGHGEGVIYVNRNIIFMSITHLIYV